MLTKIISGGQTGSSALTMKMAKEYHRPWRHINFNKTNGFEAARSIPSWISEHGIKTLNVAGSRASKDPRFMM